MSEEQSTKPSAAQSTPPGATRSGERKHFDRKYLVQAMIGLSALVFLSTAAVLYYRWATTTEPSCELTVMATAAYRGAVVKVDGPMLPRPHRVTIGEGEQYNLAFFLDPGSYEITVTLNGQAQYHGQCTLETRAIGTLDLTHIKPTTQPVTGPLKPASSASDPEPPLL